jgi:hypothetical protein
MATSLIQSVALAQSVERSMVEMFLSKGLWEIASTPLPERVRRV